MAPRKCDQRSNQPQTDDVRERVNKACDRCRLKKCKCNGETPCLRCCADNAVCVFGRLKKAHNKVYSKGYVETLEQQQVWLVHGLQKLYKRTIEGEGWSGAPPETEHNGHPLTHDLLNRLGALDQANGDRFVADLDTLQNDIRREGMQREKLSDGAKSLEGSASSTRSLSDALFQTPIHPPMQPAYTQIMAAQRTDRQELIHSASLMQGMVKPLPLQDVPQHWPNEGHTSFNELDMTLSSSDYAELSLNGTIPSTIQLPDAYYQCM